MIAVIDNYDSFTYNLVQMLGELGKELRVFRNDAVTVEKLAEMKPQAIVVSPGPGKPEDAGLSREIISYFAGKLPILGVCLGHQAIGSCFGGEVILAPKPVHGKPSNVYHDGDAMFEGVETPFTAGRYHSLILNRECIPECLKVTAETEDGIIMAVKHRDLPIYGVQFHPESIITPCGKKLLENFLRRVTL